jgi:hypothetical protein
MAGKIEMSPTRIGLNVRFMQKHNTMGVTPPCWGSMFKRLMPSCMFSFQAWIKPSFHRETFVIASVRAMPGMQHKTMMIVIIVLLIDLLDCMTASLMCFNIT